MIKDAIELIKKASQYKMVAIYGYGKWGTRIQEELIEFKFDDFCFVCTSHEYKKKSMHLGTKIYTLDELRNEVSCLFVLHVEMINFKELLSNITEYGFDAVVLSSDYKFVKQYKDYFELIHQQTIQIKRKLAIKNNIWQRGKFKFYVPNYPLDFIQNIQVEEGFFEEKILESLNKYISCESVILDIGANVGNHAMYWAMVRNVRKIYAFEPVESTYKILKKNIEINNIQSKVEAYNCGLSDKNENADFLTYRQDNIGDTHLGASYNGTMKLFRLDDFIGKIERIDFVKIDVEDYEVKVLLGAGETLKKHKPLVFVESLPDHYEEMNMVLSDMGYEQVKEYPHHNYLYKYKNSTGV